MIKLTKGPEPKVLRDNHESWTQTLLQHISSGIVTDADKTKYRHPEIKDALLMETHEKCAYCESKFRHVTYGDIEHIVPKSVSPEKTFEWVNLTVACDVCNTNKGTSEDIIDPYTDEPSEHLRFLGAIVMPVPGDHLGIMTQKTLDLNRMELVERRMERIQYLNQQLSLMAETTDAKLKQVLKVDLEDNEIAADKEYAAMSREYVALELSRLNGSAVSA